MVESSGGSMLISQFKLKRYEVFYVCIRNSDFGLSYNLRDVFIWKNFGADLQGKNNSILPGLDLAILGVLR